MISCHIIRGFGPASPYPDAVSTTGRRGKSSGEPGGGHALAGGGPSQLGVDGSLRARDVSRPDDADVEAAEKTVKVSRRPAAAPPSSRTT
jgi:hypothetical protein